MSSRKSIVAWRRALENLQQFGVERARESSKPASIDAAAAAIEGRHVAVFVDGYAGSTLEEILRMVTAQCRLRGLKPVIVTISADLDIIRSFELPLEVVLDIERQKIDDLPMQIRLDQQLRGIVRLWQPVGVVAFASRRHDHLVRRFRQLLSVGAAD